MSHHSDDMMDVGSETFWDSGNYKKTTKRIDDGYKLCNDLMCLVTERADIEKSYAKQLRSWASKWCTIIEKGPEYGTTEAAWKGSLGEAERRAELHLNVKERLQTDVVNRIKQWQKDNFHKSLLAQVTEKKELDNDFRKAQKPWVKRLEKVNKCKNDFHNSCKAERTSLNQERNATNDNSVSQEQLRKLQDRVSKAKELVARSRDSYESALEDLNEYTTTYVDEMTVVFDRCQSKEGQRLQCFKDILFAFHGCLNISADSELAQIYDEFYHTVNNADHEKDLKLWSNKYGVNMEKNWPQFEEYSEEFREIYGKSKKLGGSIAEANITLINQRTVSDELPEYTSSDAQSRGNGRSNNSRTQETNGKGASSQKSTLYSTQHRADFRDELRNGVVNSNDENVVSNPFEDEEWDEQGALPLVDNGEPGVPVRALYDYEAAEDDELNFKAGEHFEKLEDEDAQGWCKGRKDGKVGLYPANYIEVL